jgi:hypothetical protein
MPLFVFLFLSFLNSKAQNTSAFITLKNGDKVQAYVKPYKYQPDIEGVLIYENGNESASRIVSADSIQQLDINGVLFIAARVTVYTHELNLEKYFNVLNKPELKESSVTQLVFLKLLVSGSKLNLFAHKTDDRFNFFVQQPDGEIITLRYLRLFEESGNQSIKEYPYYMQQLVPYVSGNKKLERQLELTKWTEKETMGICKGINDNKMPYEIYEDNVKAVKTFRFYAGLGISKTQLNFNTSQILVRPFISTLEMNARYTPVFNFTAEFGIGLKKERFILENNIFIRPFVGEASGGWDFDPTYYVTYQMQMKGLNVSYTPVLKINLNERIAGGAGINLQYNSISITYNGFPTWYDDDMFFRLNTADFVGKQRATKSEFSLSQFYKIQYSFKKAGAICFAFVPKHSIIQMTVQDELKQSFLNLSYQFLLSKKVKK